MARWMQAIANRFGYLPRTAVARERAGLQSQLHQVRTLNAAMLEHFTSGWTGTPEHLNVETASGLGKARARSRDAAINNDHARHFVGMCLRNILGPAGIGLQVQMRKRGPAAELHTGVNDALEAAWAAWGRRGVCDVTGRYSWLMVQRLVLRHLVVDGEAIVRLVAGRGPHRLQVQLIDPALLDIDKRADLTGGVRIRMGVEFDGEGRVLAYHVRQDVPGTPDGYGTGRHMRLPADEVLHIMLPEQVNQLRGVPWMNSALKRLFLIGDFEQAAINASRQAAKRQGFFEQPLDAGGVPPGMAVDEEGVAINPLQDGQYDMLPSGYKFTPNSSQFPHTNHAEFVKSCLRSAASGLGASYVTFGNDLEAVNYSSARVGIFDEREAWKSLQRFIVDELAERVAAVWLKYAMVAAPELAALQPARTADYLQAFAWLPRRWPAIDPAKERTADKLGLELGVTSRRRIAARDGDDLDEIVAELRAEQELFADLLPAPAPASAPASAAAAGAEADDDEPGDEAGDESAKTKSRHLLRVVRAALENAR